MKFLPVKILALYLVALALFISGCSSKKSRGSESIANSGSQAQVTDGNASGNPGSAAVGGVNNNPGQTIPSVASGLKPLPEEVTPQPTQDPMSIPGHFVEFSREKLRDLGGATGITRTAAKTEARFSGKVFDARLGKDSEVQLVREFQYPDGSIVEETETVRFHSIDVSHFNSTFEVRSSFEGKHFKLTGQIACERYHSPTELYLISCSRPETQNRPSILGAEQVDKSGRKISAAQPRSNETLMLQLREKMHACAFSAESSIPLERREYGAFVVTPGLIATESERHTMISKGKVVCSDKNGRQQESSAEKMITVIRSYDSPSLLMPHVGQGLIVHFEEVVQTPERVISRTVQKVTEFIR